MKTQFHGFGRLTIMTNSSKTQCKMEDVKKQYERHRKQSFGMVNLCSKACAGHQNLLQNASKSPDLQHIVVFSVLWWRLGPSDSWYHIHSGLLLQFFLHKIRYLHKSKASGHVERRQNNKSLQNPDILRLPNNMIRIVILVALAWLVRRRIDSVCCHPKNVSGTDCPIQGPLPK